MDKKNILIFFILFSLIYTIVIIDASEIGDCKKECLNDKKNDSENCLNSNNFCKEICIKNRACINNCSKEKSNCLKKASSDYKECSKECAYVGKNITCLKGLYKAGDIFLDKCKICECGYNSRITCKKTDFCNFNYILEDQKLCESNNGLYQQLCNGPYFDIVCSADNYCLCDGLNNYSCPMDYFCLHDFNPSLTRTKYTITGWKTLLGQKLGSIGICVKMPPLFSCGNGICENIITENNSGETILNCPEDCNN